MYPMTVFYKVMSSTERVSRDRTFTSITRLRGHHIKFIWGVFKKGKTTMFAHTTSSRPSGKLCQRSRGCTMYKFGSRREKKWAVSGSSIISMLETKEQYTQVCNKWLIRRFWAQESNAFQSYAEPKRNLWLQGKWKITDTITQFFSPPHI